MDSRGIKQVKGCQSSRSVGQSAREGRHSDGQKTAESEAKLPQLSIQARAQRRPVLRRSGLRRTWHSGMFISPPQVSLCNPVTGQRERERERERARHFDALVAFATSVVASEKNSALCQRLRRPSFVL